MAGSWSACGRVIDTTTSAERILDLSAAKYRRAKLRTLSVEDPCQLSGQVFYFRNN